MKTILTIKDELKTTIYEWLCIGIVVSFVFFPIGVSILGIVLFIFWLLTNNFKKAGPVSNRWLVILFSGLYLPVLIGMFYSDNLGNALFKTQQKSALALFPLVFGFSQILQAESVRKISFSFVVSTLAGCLYCLLLGSVHFFQTGNVELLNGHPLVMLKEMNPYLMGFMCVMANVFCYETLLKKDYYSSFHKWSLFVSIIIFSVFIVLIGNRMMIFCWSFASSFYYLKLVSSIWLKVIIPTTVAVIFVLAVFFVPALNRQVKELVDRSSNTKIPLDQDGSLGRSWGGKAIRVAIWECSFDMIKENPLLGVGSGDAQDALQLAYEKRMFYFASRYNRYNAHNQYLQELVSAGFLGLIIWLGCLLIPLAIAWKKNHRTYIIFLLCIICMSITESVLEISKGIVLYSFLNSFFAFAEDKTAST